LIAGPESSAVIPEDLRYTDQHEWVADRGEVVRVGITFFAQDSLGDIVFVSLPEVGAAVHAGEPLGEVESTKSVSEIYAPLSGTVTARNDDLLDGPDGPGQTQVINDDPYGAGWLVEIQPSDPGDSGGLLDAAAYAALTNQS
jgi:glycine cleavage system H protein